MSGAGSEEYAFDAAGHPTKIGGAGTLSYDAAGQLDQATTPGGTVDYDYDAVGNRVAAAPVGGPSTQYTYDQAGRLTSVQRQGDPAITYGYDAAGLRTSRTGDGSTTRYTWDTTGGVPLLLSEGDTSYVYDAEGLPLERIDGDGNVVFLHHDQLGSTRMLTDEDGEVVGTVSYDAYGRVAGSTGSVTTPFGFAGEYTDADTGLVYLRARYYDPATGQFLTRDPLEDLSGEPYLYAGGDPIGSTDPLGLLFGIDLQDISDLSAGFGDGATGLISGAVNTVTFG